MKRLLAALRPDSLFGLIFLILVLGATANQIINFYAVASIQSSFAREALGIGHDYVSSVYMAASMMDASERDAFLQKTNASRSVFDKPFRFRVTNAPTWRTQDYYKANNMRNAVSSALRASGEEVPDIRARMLKPGASEETSEAFADYFFPLLQTVIEMKDGTWLELVQPLQFTDERLIARQRIFVFLESLIFSLIVIFLIRYATKPIERLALEAERFGRNPEESAPVDESGSREVREAARSFNGMRERIRGNLNERNAMLEAMGHDLRTPLARVQLRLDRIEPEGLREKFASDIEDIRSIVEQGLELARSQRTSEKAAPLDIVAFVESIADDAASAGGNVKIASCREREEPVIVNARAVCLRRGVENLLTNALKYAGNAEISVETEGENAIIKVEDDGPGIPEGLLEKVFEPYYRIESSRNRESGGTGLGLSIARNMVLLNDGTIALENKKAGGLSAVITLKKAAKHKK